MINRGFYPVHLKKEDVELISALVDAELAREGERASEGLRAASRRLDIARRAIEILLNDQPVHVEGA